MSASIAHLFSQHAEDYQAVAGQAAAFHEQFVQHLNASTHSYAGTEASNASSLRSLGANTGSHASANVGASNLPLMPAVNVTWPEAGALLLSLLSPLWLPAVLLAAPLLLALLLIDWVQKIGL